MTISYRSIAMPLISMRDVDTIVADSKFNNMACGITGILLFDGEFFMQTIEGPITDCLDLFAEISKDSRHDNIIPFGIQRIEERDFPGCCMELLEPDESALIVPDMKNFHFSYDRLREVQAMAIETALQKRAQRRYH